MTTKFITVPDTVSQSFKCISFISSVHIKVDEKISLSANRHGGLQNMEVRGMILLRISDPSLTGICMVTDNCDTRGFQMQVFDFSKISINFHS